jgi:purine-binding chemotaxis protein CheW
MKPTESGKVGEERQSGQNKQYLAFRIMNEIYGLPVPKVQEITGMTKITSLPDMPPFMKGIIDLRGVPVPVIDMRLKFNLIEAEYTDFTVIIIIEFRERLLGMIVDSLSDVFNVRTKSKHETASFKPKINSEYIQGIGEKDEIIVIILDSDRILTSNEFDIIYKFGVIAQAPVKR